MSNTTAQASAPLCSHSAHQRVKLSFYRMLLDRGAVLPPLPVARTQRDTLLTLCPAICARQTTRLLTAILGLHIQHRPTRHWKRTRRLALEQIPSPSSGIEPISLIIKITICTETARGIKMRNHTHTQRSSVCLIAFASKHTDRPHRQRMLDPLT